MSLRRPPSQPAGLHAVPLHEQLGALGEHIVARPPHRLCHRHLRSRAQLSSGVGPPGDLARRHTGAGGCDIRRRPGPAAHKSNTPSRRWWRARPRQFPSGCRTAALGPRCGRRAGGQAGSRGWASELLTPAHAVVSCRPACLNSSDSFTMLGGGPLKKGGRRRFPLALEMPTGFRDRGSRVPEEAWPLCRPEDTPPIPARNLPAPLALLEYLQVQTLCGAPESSFRLHAVASKDPV